MPSLVLESRSNEAASVAVVSEQALLAHPCFSHARDAYIRAYVQLYRGPEPKKRLLVRGARHLLFTFILCQWAGQKLEDRTTWLTRARIKDLAVQYRTASKGQVEAVVDRMLALKLLEEVPAPEPSRRTLLVPTDALVAHDLDLIAA